MPPNGRFPHYRSDSERSTFDDVVFDTGVHLPNLKLDDCRAEVTVEEPDKKIATKSLKVSQQKRNSVQARRHWRKTVSSNR